MLKSRDTFPPGGWQFVQVETGWRVQGGLTFNNAVAKIIEHRQANPRLKLPTDFKAVADTLETFTCHRIKFDPFYCTGEAPEKKNLKPAGPKLESPSSTVPPLSSPAAPTVPQAPIPQSPESPVVKLADTIKNNTAGVRILYDWLGDGGLPVGADAAIVRSAICDGCPLNVPAEGFSKITKKVAAAIKEQVEVKNDLKLSVPNEAKLGICSACKCHLGLKVWVPISYIKENTSEKTMKAFDSRCWILSESAK